MKPRPRRMRRLLNRMIYLGIAVLAVIFLVGFSAGGPSVPATILLLSGRVIVIVGPSGMRLQFWAGVYRADRPVRARRVRTSGP